MGAPYGYPNGVIKEPPTAHGHLIKTAAAKTVVKNQQNVWLAINQRCSSPEAMCDTWSHGLMHYAAMGFPPTVSRFLLCLIEAMGTAEAPDNKCAPAAYTCSLQCWLLYPTHQCLGTLPLTLPEQQLQIQNPIPFIWGAREAHFKAVSVSRVGVPSHVCHLGVDHGDRKIHLLEHLRSDVIFLQTL